MNNARKLLGHVVRATTKQGEELIGTLSSHQGGNYYIVDYPEKELAEVRNV